LFAKGTPHPLPTHALFLVQKWELAKCCPEVRLSRRRVPRMHFGGWCGEDLY
jgi:hypothetical protein